MNTSTLRSVANGAAWALLALAAAFVSLPGAAKAASCEDMLNLTIPDTRITAARIVPAAGDLPEYCSVLGVVSPAVGFEVRMPTNWNGKLYFPGNAVWAGRIPSGPAVAAGLRRRYATAATDTGHTSADLFDASWALDNRPAEIDHGYRSVHVTTVVAKRIIEAYYGVAPSLSYFSGCSTGGRQGLMEAQRFPEDFNGIIAGAPVLDLTGLEIDFNWDMQALYVDPASAIPVEKLPVIGNAVLAACDGVDGLLDGLIEDPRKCEFNPTTLLCPAGDGPNCLTAPQVEALKKIYAGPITSEGEPLYPGFPVGGETPDFSHSGWDAWLVNPTAPPGQFVAQDGYLRYMAFEIDEPNFDWRNFNFDTDPERMQFMGKIFNATDTDLSVFAKAGGKLLINQGWSDAVQTALRTIEYYEQVRRTLGKHETQRFARLFMAPGMFHCFGGQGPNTFDALTALEKWVEEDIAPDFIIATHFDESGHPDRTRPLCPYPQVARYRGSGSIDDAANFECVRPKR